MALKRNMSDDERCSTYSELYLEIPSKYLSIIICQILCNVWLLNEFDGCSS